MEPVFLECRQEVTGRSVTEMLKNLGKNVRVLEMH